MGASKAGGAAGSPTRSERAEPFRTGRTEGRGDEASTCAERDARWATTKFKLHDSLKNSPSF